MVVIGLGEEVASPVNPWSFYSFSESSFLPRISFSNLCPGVGRHLSPAF